MGKKVKRRYTSKVGRRYHKPFQRDSPGYLFVTCAMGK